MRNYDAWLEAPYQNMIQQEQALYDAWEAHCEAHGWDINWCDEDDPDYHMYVQWETWAELTEWYYDIQYSRMMDEAEEAARRYEDEQIAAMQQDEWELEFDPDYQW